jgi:hypothetical protein
MSLARSSQMDVSSYTLFISAARPELPSTLFAASPFHIPHWQVKLKAGTLP